MKNNNNINPARRSPNTHFYTKALLIAAVHLTSRAMYSKKVLTYNNRLDRCEDVHPTSLREATASTCTSTVDWHASRGDVEYTYQHLRSVLQQYSYYGWPWCKMYEYK